MNIVAKTDLTFQNFTFNPVVEDGQVWLTSTELAKVLEYKKTDAISQIYARNSDEFTSSMTTTLKLSVIGINNSLRRKSVRVYSLRGAHLIAMFSNTPVAKEFRKWALDILDKEVAVGNDSPVSKEFKNCRVLYSYNEMGIIIKAEVAEDDEYLTSGRNVADSLKKRGYVLVKVEDFNNVSLGH